MRKRRPPMQPMYQVIEAAARPLPKWRKATKAETQGATLRSSCVAALIILSMVVLVYWTGIVIGGDRP
jgi:fatty acid desaturase